MKRGNSLVQASLILEDQDHILVVPKPIQRSAKRSLGKSRVLTSSGIQRELEEKETQKQHTIDKIKRNKREEKRAHKHY